MNGFPLNYSKSAKKIVRTVLFHFRFFFVCRKKNMSPLVRKLVWLGVKLILFVSKLPDKARILAKRVDNLPWPMFAAAGTFLCLRLIPWFPKSCVWLLFFSLVATLISILCWGWRARGDPEVLTRRPVDFFCEALVCYWLILAVFCVFCLVRSLFG